MAARRRRAGALRYCHLDDWTVPCSLYLVEKGDRPNLWLIARPALIPSQEDESTVPVSIPEAGGEKVVYERVVLSGDQDGVMGSDCLFTHLEDDEETPYTLSILLANCPAELRFGPREFTLSPNGGGGRMDRDDHPPTRLGGGTRPTREQDARPSGSDGGGSNATTDERLDEILHAITAQNSKLEAQNSRLNALEQEQRAALAGPQAVAARAALKTGTGAFDDNDMAGINASDRELIAELMKARPKDPVARSSPSAVHEAAVGPQLPVNEMLQRATLALEQVAGRPSGLLNVEKAGPKFKLLGAQGRVQQDALNKAFNDDPAAVVREFEAAVKSLAAIDPHEPLTGHIIQETWRNHVPAKDHAQIVRTSEAVLDAYLALRQGNVARGMARLALLLAAMEQSVLDQGKWDLRAETLLGLPRAPLHSYRAPTAEQKPSGENKLGPLAQFCSADRSTTALAVYRDNHPVTNR